MFSIDPFSVICVLCTGSISIIYLTLYVLCSLEDIV